MSDDEDENRKNDQNSDDFGFGASSYETASASDIALRIAALSKELSQLTQMAAHATPRKLETDAMTKAFQQLADAYAADPNALSQAQLELSTRQTQLFQSLAAGTTNQFDLSGKPLTDPSWQDNPFYAFLQSAFATNADWAESLAMNAPGMSERDKLRAAFLLRQTAAAMSPANSLMGNPKALKAMFESQGASVRQGVENLRADLDPATGRPNLTQSDPDAFQIGQTIAASPGEVVMQNELIELIRYFPSTDEVRETPILIYPPWINKYYVLDLKEENSLVAWLRDQGLTVYIVSWRSADHAIRNFDWDDYVELGGRAALDWVHDAHEAPVNTAGYCVGGALLSLLAADLAAKDDDRIASITLLAAQTDFSEPGELGLFIDEESIPGIEKLIEDADGVMPGEAMRDAFNLLRPNELIWRYVEQRYLMGESPPAFDLLFWNSDQTNLPGPLHLQSLKRLYLENALAKGAFEVDGEAVNLSSITCPVFIHAARKDHISPFPSVYKGVHLFGGDTTFLLADSGHIAGVINPPAAQKYRYWTGPHKAPKGHAAWFADATEHPGSWWPVWADWLSETSGDNVEPPPPLDDVPAAPGSNVLETLASIRARQS